MKRLLVLALAGCPAPNAPSISPQPDAVRKAMAHYDIRASSLPAPYATPDADNGSNTVPRPDGATLTLPPDFRSPLRDGGWKRPRSMALAPNGDVFVVDSEAGALTVLRDANGDGIAKSGSYS